MKHLRTPYLILIAAVAALAAASCTKERSTDYDTEMLEFAGNYYGAIGDNGEHCYYICLSDKGFSNSGELIPGALYYYFDIFSTAPSDASLITIPTGLYTLGARGTTAVGTFTQENSIFVQTGRYDVPVELVFSEGHLEIDRDDNGRYTFEAELTDVAGMTHRLHYTGPAVLTDYSQGTGTYLDLNTDLNIQAIQAMAIDTEIPGLGQDISNVILSMTDMSSDAEGYVIPPGSIINMDCYMVLTEDGRIPEGRYDITDNWMTEDSALSPGETIDGYYVGTLAEHYDDGGHAYLGFVNSGFMTVSHTEDSGYSVVFDFSTTTGNKVTGRYSGPISIQPAGTPATASRSAADSRLHRPVFNPMTHSHYTVRSEQR